MKPSSRNLVLVHILLAFATIKYVLGSVSLSSIVASWEDAREFCYSNGETLVNANDLSQTDLTELSQKVSKGAKIWTDGFYNYTEYVWIYGCSDIINPSDVRSKDFRMEISLVNCLTFCSNYTFVAMLRLTCYCVTMTDLAAARDPSCSFTCQGDDGDLCGGRTQASVYKRFDYREITFDPDADKEENCVYVSKKIQKNAIAGDDNTSGEMIWGTENCEVELDGFVTQEFNINPIDYTYRVMYSKRNFDDSMGFCAGNTTLSLAYVYSTAQKLATMRDNERYWIGLYRRDFTGTMPDLCAALEFGTDITTTREDCTLKYKALCAKDDSTTLRTGSTIMSTEGTTESTVDTIESTTKVDGNGTSYWIDFETSRDNITETTRYYTTETTTSAEAGDGGDIVVIDNDINDGDLSDTADQTGNDPPEADVTTASSDADNVFGDSDEQIFINDGKLRLSAVILIIVLAVLFLLIFILIVFLLIRRRKKRKEFSVAAQKSHYINKGYEFERGPFIVKREKNNLVTSKDSTTGSPMNTPPKPARQRSLNRDENQIISYENVNLYPNTSVSLPRLQNNSTFKPQPRETIDIPMVIPKSESLDIPYIDSSRDNLDIIVRDESKTELKSNASNASFDPHKSSSVGNLDLHIDQMFAHNGLSDTEHAETDRKPDPEPEVMIENGKPRADDDDGNKSDSSSSSSSSAKTASTEMNRLDISDQNGRGNYSDSDDVVDM